VQEAEVVKAQPETETQAALHLLLELELLLSPLTVAVAVEQALAQTLSVLEQEELLLAAM